MELKIQSGDDRQKPQDQEHLPDDGKAGSPRCNGRDAEHILLFTKFSSEFPERRRSENQRRNSGQIERQNLSPFLVLETDQNQAGEQEQSRSRKNAPDQGYAEKTERKFQQTEESRQHTEFQQTEESRQHTEKSHYDGK